MNAPRTRRTMARVWRAATAGLLFALPACRIPELRQADAGTTMPATFGSGAPATATGPTLPPPHGFYTDPTLVDLLTHTVAGNQELRILGEEVEVAANDVLSRRGAIFPSVGLELGGGFERNSAFTPIGAAERQLLDGRGQEFPDPVPRLRVGAGLTWQVDIWRELRNARDAAAARYTAAAERRNAFVTRLVAEVADHYYRLLALDGRLVVLDQTIALQEESLKVAIARKEAGRGTELAVQRFQAEVRKNQSEKLVVRQEQVEVENRLNFLAGRFPQPVARNAVNYADLNLVPPAAGLPVQLLANRPDIRQAERELAAAGLDVKVARARFYPRLDIFAGVGWEAFNPRYLFDPGSFVATAAGGLVAPVINRAAIKADYLTANARQLQAAYNYQRVTLDAFREVATQLAAVENFRQSVEVRKQQIQAQEASVDSATKLFQAARVEYIEVLFAQRDLLDARLDLLDTKRRQLAATVAMYQALGGGAVPVAPATPPPTTRRPHKWFDEE